MAAKLSRITTVILLCIALKVSGQSGPKPVPDKDTYGAFLMAPWKDGAPSLIAFKDPLCGFCIKALKNRQRLENYNVFLFWSPILSARSEQQVKQIFQCEEPVSDDIMDAVMMRKSPNCSGKIRTELKVLNDKFVAQYDPRFVPQYWFGGRQQRLSALNLTESRQAFIAQVRATSPIKIPWQRYDALKVSQNLKHNNANIALVLPDSVTLTDETMRLLKSDSRLNWFVFADESLADNKALEFKMLNNIVSVPKPLFILEGKQLTEQELVKVVSDKLRSAIL